MRERQRHTHREGVVGGVGGGEEGETKRELVPLIFFESQVLPLNRTLRDEEQKAVACKTVV